MNNSEVVINIEDIYDSDEYYINKVLLDKNKKDKSYCFYNLFECLCSCFL